MGRLARRLFGISPMETSFEVRGFVCDDDAIRERLENVGAAFVVGYNSALEDSTPEVLSQRLHERLDTAHQGFAYEGAGMALALLDTVLPGASRLDRFLAGPAARHFYLVYVGAGWILGRLPLSPERLMRRLPPIHGWLALDGYGFHETFFHPERTVAEKRWPRRVQGYARRVFDQGVGRSLWFVEAADPERLARTVGSFPIERRQDLWSGVGLASAYAGGLGFDALAVLFEAAGPHRAALAQGAAFAAEARRKAENLTRHTELACEIYWQRDAEAAAQLTIDVLETLSPEDGTLDAPAYELWRRGIQADHPASLEAAA